MMHDNVSTHKKHKFFDKEVSFYYKRSQVVSQKYMKHLIISFENIHEL